ncbi:transcriptional regulator [Chromatiales bacterium (ex Bugula neritina AB1)]|nr:transcriptional regulator [Chromatiales bacterium (ex Bugula neritina AB1)]
MALSGDIKNLLGDTETITRSNSLADDAAQTLRAMILLEKLPPGTALPERDLAEALGVSRTPLREAIRLLATEGLVQYTAARRPFVADPTLTEIKNCLRIQGALEALAGQLACEYATDAELQHIEQLNRQIVQASADGSDRLAAFRTDMDFHIAIVAAAKNEPLAETHAQYNARLWRVRFLSSQRSASRQSTQREHENIVASLLARNKSQTAIDLKQHLTTAETNIELAVNEKKNNEGDTTGE